MKMATNTYAATPAMMAAVAGSTVGVSQGRVGAGEWG